MEDQTDSPEKYSIKNSYYKNIFHSNEKKQHMIEIFLTKYKIILIE